MIETNTTTSETYLSYWEDTGRFQKDFDRLTKEHMRPSGPSLTIEGELIRIANRFYYEWCNNGNCNLFIENWVDEEYYIGTDDEGDEEYDTETTLESVEVSPFYQELLDFTIKTLKDSNPEIITIIDSIIEYATNRAIYENSYKFNKTEHDLYNPLVDAIMEYVLPREGNFDPLS